MAKLPLPMKAGLGIACAGAAIDVGYHLATSSAGAGHGPVAFVGHLVTLTGMVVTVSGLLAVALERRPARARPRSKGEIR